MNVELYTLTAFDLDEATERDLADTLRSHAADIACPGDSLGGVLDTHAPRLRVLEPVDVNSVPPDVLLKFEISDGDVPKKLKLASRPQSS